MSLSDGRLCMMLWLFIAIRATEIKCIDFNILSWNRCFSSTRPPNEYVLQEGQTTAASQTNCRSYCYHVRAMCSICWCRKCHRCCMHQTDISIFACGSDFELLAHQSQVSQKRRCFANEKWRLCRWNPPIRKQGHMKETNNMKETVCLSVCLSRNFFLKELLEIRFVLLSKDLVVFNVSANAKESILFLTYRAQIW